MPAVVLPRARRYVLYSNFFVCSFLKFFNGRLLIARLLFTILEENGRQSRTYLHHDQA